jgi:hypothetical protein
MKITVTLTVDVDLDAWQVRYGSPNIAYALVEVLHDLRQGDAWSVRSAFNGLGAVESATAHVDLNKQG